ncbi:MAG: hypothetical protein K9G59_17550 [Caulobacter sp.]|nr:hypothetical protein [Caulobacter sp.]
MSLDADSQMRILDALEKIVRNGFEAGKAELLCLREQDPSNRNCSPSPAG